VVVFRIGRRLWGDAAGLVAAFFSAWPSARPRFAFGTTDVAMTLLIMLSIGLLLDAHLENRRSKFVMAGAVAGLAAATKYNAVLPPVVMLASQILHALELPTGHLVL
jgi:4-amino-4-deoxy-L-arabinose transferase-like glycosyltransferase